MIKLSYDSTLLNSDQNSFLHIWLHEILGSHFYNYQNSFWQFQFQEIYSQIFSLIIQFDLVAFGNHFFNVSEFRFRDTFFKFRKSIFTDMGDTHEFFFKLSIFIRQTNFAPWNLLKLKSFIDDRDVFRHPRLS